MPDLEKAGDNQETGADDDDDEEFAFQAEVFSDTSDDDDRGAGDAGEGAGRCGAGLGAAIATDLLRDDRRLGLRARSDELRPVGEGLPTGPAEELLQAGEPFVGQGQTFAAWKDWADVSQLRARFGSVPFQVGRSSEAAGEAFGEAGRERQQRKELPLATFLDYAAASTADWPLALQEPDWEGPHEALRCELSSPACARQDLYSYVPLHAPAAARLALHVGGPLAGQLPRRHPDAATGWHTVISGTQLWALGPPSEAPAAEGKRIPPAAWFLDRHAGRRVLLSAGETIFIPAGWWFASVVLPGAVSVSIGQAVLLPATLPRTLPILRQRRPRFLQRLQAAGAPGLPAAPPTTVRPRREDGTGGYGVRRLHFSELSVAAFRRGMMHWAEPLIVVGLGSYLATEASLGLALEFLREALPPDLKMPVKLGGSVVPSMPASDFFDLWDRGEEVYLADLSIADYFPWLFQQVRMPRYILHCFAHRTRREHRWSRNKTPALFVGQDGSKTALHMDQLASSFCMFLAEGSKQWTCFHRDDKDRLAHEWDANEQIRRFRPLQEDGTAELTATGHDVPGGPLRRVDFVLHEGEVLFVPFDTPHEVRNLTPTVAVAANYWDQANVAPAIDQLKEKVARMDPAGARYANLDGLRAALDEIDWPALEEDLLGGAEDDAPRVGEDMAVLHPCHEAAKHVRPTSWGA